MSETEPTVFVVVDEASVRRSTERLVRSMGFDAVLEKKLPKLDVAGSTPVARSS